ncbi:MAG: hypothetical protein AAGA20_22580 [Planctomycetota bacterium]
MRRQTALALIAAAAIAALAFAGLRAGSSGAPPPSPGPAANESIDELRAEVARLAGAIDVLGERMEDVARSAALAPVSAGAARQPAVRPSGDPEQLEVLLEMRDLLADLNSRLSVGGGGRGGSPPSGGRRLLRSESRPIDMHALEELVAAYPNDSDPLPIDLAMTGIEGIIDRFGYPDEVVPSRNADQPWTLLYDEVDLSIEGRPVDDLYFRSDHRATYGVHYRLGPRDDG